MKEIVLATSNAGKIQELQAILSPILCLPQSDFLIQNIEETGLSFIENAILKARHASKMTKKPALADDSGLVVAALQGAPGIFSARFAGVNASDAENIALLLEKMQDIAEDKRRAFFYCAMAFVTHETDPVPLIATGSWSGFITHKPSGTQGFGYDPIFYVPTHDCTAAELEKTVKNTISHRAQALKALQKLWKKDD